MRRTYSSVPANLIQKIKDKVRPGTGHEGPEKE
jgi:hypothetical protein